MKHRFVKKGQAYIDPSKAKQLMEKWAPVLNFESASVAPITNDRTRFNTAMLLENQERYCLLGEGNTVGGGVFGANSTADWGGSASGTPGTDAYAPQDARLPKILIPMIRRTFPELISNEIVGVQPMSGPVGLAFALRYKYNNEALGYGIDGVKDNSKSNQGGWGVTAEADALSAQEIGYQHLDTRFTGAKADYLNGLVGACRRFKSSRW
jgi:hypothetical protein